MYKLIQILARLQSAAQQFTRQKNGWMKNDWDWGLVRNWNWIMGHVPWIPQCCQWFVILSFVVLGWHMNNLIMDASCNFYLHYSFVKVVMGSFSEQMVYLFAYHIPISIYQFDYFLVVVTQCLLNGFYTPCYSQWFSSSL